MLAQSFKTAEELGLDDAEYGALVTVLGMLERGELVHGVQFNMFHWCGTACCIGGWAEIIGRLPARQLSEKAFEAYELWEQNPARVELNNLFYPDSIEALDLSYLDMAAIKPEQAATALRSYLTTGEPRWHEALS